MEKTPKGINWHHTVWCRAWYKTCAEKNFRLHSGLIVPMHIPVHNELHANIPPPPKPTRESMLGATALLNDLSDTQLHNYLDTIERVGDFMISREQKIGEYLLLQLPYIEEGLWKIN